MTTDLQDILSDIRACRACAGVLPHTPRPVVRVFPETRLLICGQAPGRRVHESGVPFTDPSGGSLERWRAVRDDPVAHGERGHRVADRGDRADGELDRGEDEPRDEVEAGCIGRSGGTNLPPLCPSVENSSAAQPSFNASRILRVLLRNMSR